MNFKTSVIKSSRGAGLVLSLLLSWSGHSLAQIDPWPTNALIPVVIVRATDPLASWSGDPGAFTFFRDGPTNATLIVYYLIGGSATNGVDYDTLGNWVTIPAGTRSNTVTVQPVGNGQTVTKTVTLKLSPSPMMPPVNYVIGQPGSASVFITPTGVTNIPPIVTLTSPSDHQIFSLGTPISLISLAADMDGFVSRVEFFANSASLGVATNWAVVDPPGPGQGYIPGSRAFFLVWTNAPAGDFLLTAEATDNGGASSISDPVKISVLTNSLHTNRPPVARITSPPNGAVFRAPVNIPIYAYARDDDGTIASVEFFDGTNDLGSGQGLCLLSALPIWHCPTNVFLLVWTNAPVGDHEVTAVATDNQGASTGSPAVHVRVVPSPPPPTNRPPIVSIVASDPVAIEGTNCWPWLGLTNLAPTWSNWQSGFSISHWITNCGPKDATFVVHRLGVTNDDLEVAYVISGTATNGVDYVPLSGSVTILAGTRRAEITVVPLEDGPPDVNSTVILTLTPSTNYHVGWPPRAAAIIVDGQWPRPGGAALAGNSFALTSSGPDGAWYHVEYSTDLRSWTSICTNQVVNGAITFIDPDAPTNPARFYRTVPELNPASN